MKDIKINQNNVIFFLLILIIYFLNNSALSLVVGMLFATFFKNPFENNLKTIIQKSLSIAIIGIGAGMNIEQVLKTGVNGVSYTFLSIAFTILFGILLGKIFKNNSTINLLTTAGTAICGGSAIAAVSTAIDAEADDVSISLAIIFILNSIALLVFPPVGHFYNMTQEQFGLWSALAIHDTSSVIGASLSYGAEALKIATTIKLARALWIIPLTIFLSFYSSRIIHKNKTDKSKFKFPWFILGFLLMSFIFTYIEPLSNFSRPIEIVSKKIFLIVLFLIGTNLSLTKIKKVGLKLLLSSTLLWLIISVLTLTLINKNIITV